MQSATQWLLRLQSPDLTEDEERQFFAWLESSAEHQQAYIEAEAYWENLASLKDYQSADTIPVARRWYPQAIAASVIFLAGWLLLHFNSAHELETYRSGIGQQQQISLNDGSSIILNTDSQIRIEPLSPSKPRVVYLDSGEALFSVQPDPSRPFIVSTPQGAVRVLGTQFSVRADDGDMLVTVVEGKVAIAETAVEQSQINEFKIHTTLTADQQLSIVQARQGLLPIVVDAKSLTFWKEGKLVYNGVTLNQVAKDLSRYFEGDITLGDESLGNRKIVAVIELKDKTSAMAAIESAFSVVAVNRTDALTVLYPK